MTLITISSKYIKEVLFGVLWTEKTKLEDILYIHEPQWTSCLVTMINFIGRGLTRRAGKSTNGCLRDKHFIIIIGYDINREKS